MLQDDDLASRLAPLLADFLPRQRWFSGDIPPGRGGGVVVTSLEVHRKDPLLAWLTVEVGQSIYQLVIGGRPVDQDNDFLVGKERVTVGELDGVTLYDALIDPELAIDVLALVAPHEKVEVARPLLVEQTNTSVVYDERLILKFFRRLHPEPNPDVEITRRLGERGFPHVVTQRAELRRGSMDLAVVRDYLLASTDAWHLAHTSLRDLLASRLPPDEAGADFGPDAATLGEVTAGLHIELAEVFGVGPGQPTEWLEQMLTSLDRTNGIPERERVQATLTGLVEGVADDPGMQIRTHGDLHLGQLLQADSGWFVLDFEGEPARPVAERIRPTSPLRDVAGMLRSFHYVAQAALIDRGRDVDPGLNELADEWQGRAAEAFLTGYTSGVNGTEHLLPTEEGNRRSLLTAFELDKAVYEVGYELAHRPAWADIPTSAIKHLL